MKIVPPARKATRVALSHPLVEVLEHSLEDDRRVVTLSLRDWVVVIAEDEAENLVLVHQHRHGVDATTLECPGGVIDPGETPADAARRELLEETGYEVRDLEPFGVVHPNPALHGNQAFFFHARGARRVGEPEGGPEEDTRVALLPVTVARAAIEDGRISHGISVLAIERLLTRRVAALLDEMAAHQRRRIAALAERLRPGLSLDDLKQPHDFPELADPDFHFEDGQLAGIEAVAMALRGTGGIAR
ncbi:MAG: NUDIX hydrolase [Polyangiaceae bacterium]